MSVDKKNDGKQSSIQADPALSGKKTNAVRERKIADMRKRSRLRRLHSYEEAKAKNARSRIHSIYSHFQRSEPSKPEDGAEKKQLKNLPKTARDQQSAEHPAREPKNIQTIDLTGSDDRGDFASGAPANGISSTHRVFRTEPAPSNSAINRDLSEGKNLQDSVLRSNSKGVSEVQVARHTNSAPAEFGNPHSDSTFTRLDRTNSQSTSPHFPDLASSLFVQSSSSSSTSTSTSDTSSDFGELSIISVSNVSVTGGGASGVLFQSTNRQDHTKTAASGSREQEKKQEERNKGLREDPHQGLEEDPHQDLEELDQHQGLQELDQHQGLQELDQHQGLQKSDQLQHNTANMSSIDATVRQIPTQNDVIVSASSSSSSNASNSSNMRDFAASQGSQNMILVSSTQRSEPSSGSRSSSVGKEDSPAKKRTAARAGKRKQKQTPSADKRAPKRARRMRTRSASPASPPISEKRLKMPRTLSIHRHRALSEIHVSRILQRHRGVDDEDGSGPQGGPGLQEKAASGRKNALEGGKDAATANSQEQHLTSSPMAPPSTPATPQSASPKRVAFSSDLESSPTPSSPIKGAPEPRSILKHAKDSGPSANLSMEIVHRDLSRNESWPDGYVIHNLLGSATLRSKVIAECVLGLSNPGFTKKYEVFATINEIIKSNSRDSAKSLFGTQQVHILARSIDCDLESTAKELKNGSNAFRIRTSIQGLKVLTFLMVHYQVKGASTMLKRIACMLASANLSKGLAAAILLLLKDQQNPVVSSAVETITGSILQMKYFMSATIITEKLMTIKKLINMHPAVMSKLSYQWLSHVLCCILNTEVPSYERIVNACIYVIYEFSKNTESKDSVLQLMNETLNSNASSIRASTMSSLDANTKVVDALTLTLVYMINRGLCAQALDIWTYTTFMMGYRLTNQVDLNSWPGLGHWLKVFDEAFQSKSDDIKVAALGSWRAVLFNYQNSRSFSSASLTKDEFDLKRCIFLYPFNCVPEPCSQKVLHAYVVLYYRLIRFLRTLTIMPGRKKAVPQDWVLESIFSPFYVVFLKRPDFIPTGIKMLVNVLRFRERPTLKSLDNAEACFRKTSIDDWTLSCLPKHLLLSHYNGYYDLINFLLFNDRIPIKSKMLVFDTLTATLEDCTKNAIVPFDAAQGFLKLLENYLHQYGQSTTKGDAKKPEVSYLCSLVLRAKSVFGLRILTGKSVSMNLVTLMGAFIYKWHGTAGIADFVRCMHGVLHKKVAFMFLGLLLLHEPLINTTLIDALSSHSVSLSIMLSEFDIWKDVILGLDLNGKHINVVIDKIIEYEKLSSSAAHYNNLSCFIANFSAVADTGLPRDATKLLLSEYATRCSRSTEEAFSPIRKTLSAFVQTASADEIGSLAAALPENRCPLYWYTEVISRCASFPDNASLQVEPVRIWLQDSFGYLEDKHGDKLASVVDSVHGTLLKDSFARFFDAKRKKDDAVSIVEVIPIEDEPGIGNAKHGAKTTEPGSQKGQVELPKGRVDVNASIDATADETTDVSSDASAGIEVRSSVTESKNEEPPKDAKTDKAKVQQVDPSKMQNYYTYSQQTNTNCSIPNAAGQPNQYAYQGPSYAPPGYYGIPDAAADLNAASALNAALHAPSAALGNAAPPNAVAELQDAMQRIRGNPNQLLAVSADQRESLEDQLLDIVIRIRALRRHA
ncbi:hypothetical protein HII13_004096 [Brettanomyces bruxellensis]|nr:hypothetical protein HII13_004096 [Brettanomyces bruxellensis]